MPDLEPPEVPPLLAPSTSIPCSNVSKDCLPCDDDPIANFTAEGADSDRFSFIFRAHVVPPLGVTPGDVDRPGFCYSTVSEQDAEDCAREDAEEALVDQPTYNGVTVYHNTVQSCTANCPDGSPFTYTVPSGTVVAFSQLEADQRAYGLACSRARTNKVCILTTALNTGCLGSSYSMTLRGLGGTPIFVSWYTKAFLEECIGEVSVGDEFPYLWWITHGELPDGLTLHPCSGVIDGTPTEVGNFPITMRATDGTGAYLEKNFTLMVTEITNDSPLDDGSIGSSYLVNFSTTIGDAEQQTWTVVSGSLPAGLSLTTAGVLSGTPTTSGTSNFTIKVVESGSSGFTCEKEFSLEVTGCPIAGTNPWNCPVDVAEKRLIVLEGSPSYPLYVSSIDRVVIADSTTLLDVIDFNLAVPASERTISAGIAGAAPLIVGEQFYDEDTDQIIALVRTGAASPRDFTICFYNPSDGSLNGSIFLGTATFSGREGSNFCAINKTGKIGLSIVLNASQSFDDIYIIDPVTRTIVTSRQMPIPGTTPEDYSLCYACDMNQLIIVERASDTIYKLNHETLDLEDTFSIGSNIDTINYIDSTGRIWAYSEDAIPRFLMVVNPSTGAVETTFNVGTGAGNFRGHPIYNRFLDSWIIGIADINAGTDNALWYYNVSTFVQTCDIRRDWDQASQNDEMGWMTFNPASGTVYTHAATGFGFDLEQVTPT